MINYKLIKNIDGVVCAVFISALNTSVPLNPENKDYQNFKTQINQDQAQLEDSEGVLMSPEEAKAFVKELP
jgi:hypothetical protein